MGWFTKPKDPMSARQAELDREIEAIQRRISDLAARPLPQAGARSLRSRESRVAVPVAADRPTPSPAPVPMSVAGPRAGATVPADRFNLVEAWQRWMQRLGIEPRRPSGLVHLMAAGSVHGLRPLRYERRIARRRFLFSLSLLLLLLYGIAREVF
jgi:hypothetical protein